MTRLQTLALIALVIFPSLIFGVADIAPTRSVQGFVSGNDLVQVLPPTNTAPVITLVGQSTVTLTEGDSYSSAGATCSDNEDGSITVPAPTYSPALNLNSAGSYVATYTCTDAGGLTDTVTRTVNVNSAGGASTLAFTETTTTVMPDIDTGGGQAPVVAPFEGDWGYLNDDTCLDLVVQSHATDDPDGIYVQDVSANVCQGTFTYVPNSYRADNGASNRFTSALMILDADNDGDADLFGHDADGNPSLAAIQTGAGPTFTPSLGCRNSVDRCVMIDYNNDGDLEFVGAPLVGVSFDADVLTASSITGEIYNYQDDTTVFTPDWASIAEPNITRAWDTPLIFDANGDSYPDMVYSQLNLIWFGSAAGFTTPTSGNFTAPAAFFSTVYNTDADEHSNHHARTFFDFDNDGDMDIVKMRVQKGGNNPVDVADADADGDGLFLLQNDGTGVFTDVSATELAGIALTSLTYQTTYAGIGAGDFDNDGRTDLRVDWTDGSFTNTCVILKNGGTGNWSKHSFPCSYVLSTADGRVAASGGASKTVFAHGDYDNDGKLDLVGSNAQRTSTKDTVSVHRNTSTGTGNYLSMFVRGGVSHDGYHSRITVKAAGSNTVLCSREIYVAAQFGTTNPHCGLGTNTLVDIDLQLPHGGALVQFTNVAANQTVALYATGQIQTVSRGGALPPATVASAVNTTVNLIADSTITPTSTEQVTFAVPFADGDVLDVSELRVSVGGSEVAAAVEEILTYRGTKNGVRAARIQLPSVDMTGGNVAVTISDEGATVARATFADQAGEFATEGATKDSQPYKRIWAQHNLDYVAGSGLIPPYATGAALDTAYATYAEHQVDNWAIPFDYSTSSQANWLFDRAGALYKLYMQFGDTKYLREAFLAFRYYISNIQLSGTVAGGRGGWIGDTVDDKYAYSEAVMLHYALTGDDTWLPGGDSVSAVVTDMALRALDHSEQGGIYTSLFSAGDGYESEREFFTERRTGLTLWGAAVACSMTGDTTLCNRVSGYIGDLVDHQQVNDSFDTANGWDTKTGAFIHSWLVHECGGCFAGSPENVPLGSVADRRFSPWMSSNIQLALWSMHWMLDSSLIANYSELPELMRGLAEAVHNYGLDPSPIGASSNSHGFKAYTGTVDYTYGDMTFCDATDSSPFVLYTAAPYATQAQLFDPIPYTGTAAGTVKYPDNRASTHYGEVMGLLAQGLYFETDPTKRTALETTIANLSDVYTTACSTWFLGQGTERAFQWQFFTNPRATYDWVRVQ